MLAVRTRRRRVRWCRCVVSSSGTSSFTASGLRWARRIHCREEASEIPNGKNLVVSSTVDSRGLGRYWGDRAGHFRTAIRFARRRRSFSPKGCHGSDGPHTLRREGPVRWSRDVHPPLAKRYSTEIDITGTQVHLSSPIDGSIEPKDGAGEHPDASFPQRPAGAQLARDEPNGR